MKITNWLFHHPGKLALLIFVTCLALYVSTIPAVNIGYADSDEFLAVAQHWGLAHPPGYSLYITFLWLFMHLPLPFTTIAFRGHLLTAVSVAAAFSLSSLLLRQLYLDFFPARRRSIPLFLLSLFVVLFATTTSTQLWLYSQITEKYLFAAPLVILLIYFGYRLTRKPNPPQLTFGLFGLCFSLLVAHHQSFVFLIPYVILVLFKSLKTVTLKIRSGLWALAGIFIGLSLWLSLLTIQISRQANVPVSWQTKPGLSGVMDMITRADFRGELYAQNITTNGYLPKYLSIGQFLKGTLVFLTNYGQSYTWWIYLPLIVGILFLFSKRPRFWLWQLSLPGLLMGPLLLSYLSWPNDIGSQAITERFFLTTYFMFLPLLFVGLTEILLRLKLSAQQLQLASLPITIIAGILPLALVIRAILLYPQISLRDFNLVSRLYQSELLNIKPNSLVTCYSDTACFALIYEQAVNHLRPDVDVVPLAYPLVSHSLQAKSLSRFSYPKNPFYNFDIVTNGLNSRPVYAFDLSRYYFSLFGVANGYLYTLPAGYKLELSRTMPKTLPTTDSSLTTWLLHQPLPTFDKYRLFLAETVAQDHVANSYTYLKRGDRALAQQELSLAMNLAYRLTPTQTANMASTRASLESMQIDPRFAASTTVPTPQTILASLPDLYQKKQYGRALTLIMGALTVDPNYLPARLELARLYQLLGDLNFSRLEYSHVLIIDPTNQDALAALR